MANKRKSPSDGPKKHRHAHATKSRSRSPSSSKRGSSAHRDDSAFPVTPNHPESQANRFGSSIAVADFRDDQDDSVSEDQKGEEDEIV
jgi:hypothetical protein